MSRVRSSHAQRRFMASRSSGASDSGRRGRTVKLRSAFIGRRGYARQGVAAAEHNVLGMLTMTSPTLRSLCRSVALATALPVAHAVLRWKECSDEGGAPTVREIGRAHV